MDQNVQNLINKVKSSTELSIQEKTAILSMLNEIEKNISITEFKLDRTEKVKRTTAILLEETIEELEQKRKAVEKQKRELEIESGLERVRAKAMAMKSSEELNELIGSVFTELTKLDFVLTRCIILIFDETGGVRWWMANSEAPSTPMNFYVKYHEQQTHLAYLKGWKERTLRWEYSLDGQIKKDWDNYLFAETELASLPDFVIAGMKEPDRVHLSCSFNNFGCVSAASLEPLTAEQFDILIRFAKVFDLTYTRFNDLKKVEAQAREAQIQLALERVRARTMAMHSSAELNETAELLFDQLRQLGAHLQGVAFAICEKNSVMVQKWTSIGVFSHPYTIEPGEQRMYEAWKNEEGFYAEVYEGERQKKYYEAFMQIPAFRQGLQKFIDSGQPIPKWQKNHAVTFKYGYLLFITTQPFAETQIFIRFGKVFEQTYTRFLDLQKAEAQAREAEIQLALERVRAKSLAMHRSDELRQVVSVMFDNLTKLDFVLEKAAVCIMIFSEDSKDYVQWIADPSGAYPKPFNTPYVDMPLASDILTAKASGEHFFAKIYPFDEKNKFFEFLFQQEDYKQVPNQVKQMIFASEQYGISVVLEKNTGILLPTNTGQLASPEQAEILKRFAKVFEQSYIRFLDLQRAEAQAREAQIETDLERVRSRSMAMHKSDELKEVIRVVLDQFIHLNINVEHAGFYIDYKNHDDMHIWLADPNIEPFYAIIPYFDTPTWNSFLEAKAKGIALHSDLLNFEEKNKFYESLFQFFTVPEEAKRFYLQCKGLAVSTVLLDNVGLYIENFSAIPYTDEENKILMRFGKVFQQTYTRFLDLQKAEAQAREGQIQLALERVRARTMAMQKSDELTDVASLLFNQLSDLGIKTWTTGFNIWSEDNNSYEDYITSPKGGFIQPYIVDTSKTSVLKEISDARKKGEKFFVQYAEGERLKETYIQLAAFGDEKQYDKMLEDGVQFPSHQYDHFVFGARVSLMFITYEPVPEAYDIFIRLGNVFEQTYTRFLDLQKAEEQAVEAKIEASLERVRAKTMAMHNSADVGDTVVAMFAEFEHLGIHTNRCGILIFIDENSSEVWTARSNPDGKAALIIGVLNLRSHNLLSSVYNAWKARDSFFQYDLIGENLVSYYDAINKSEFYRTRFDMNTLPSREYHSDFFFAEGAVFTFTGEPIKDEHSKIIKRFANVFGQTYRRYLDLQKAEAQAREAQIEAALERVRGKAMAMHNSHDVSEAANLVFTELRKLVATPLRSGVGLLNNESPLGQLYSATSSAEADSLSLVGSVMLKGHPVMEKIYESWQIGEDYFPVLNGKELKSYYDLLLANFPVNSREWEKEEKHFGTFINCSIGCLYAWSTTPYNEAEIKIIKRFATIIDLTFRRYIELQQSESNAKEAVKRAALDRIRAEIASMRTIADLDRITPTIWNELTILGVPFIRCGVFIMDNSQKLIHTFLSTPEGKAIAAFHIPYDSPGNIELVISNWQKKKIYVDHWDEAEFNEFASTLVSRGALDNKEQYLRTIPEGGFYLHFTPFLQGMLYVGNKAQLKEEELNSVHLVAEAFSTAYARYEDFNRLEAAKQQIEKTLTDLKQTQQQLVQSEKMASLGELTAGIAHEIQNPLNFVNNFSEVSNELIAEMKEELEKGNAAEAINIAEDIKQNLEKINHHGKRADGIVKGMLQHSRNSSAVKEPTDINALADEYVRLSYHGLRAKDKSFNAKFFTNFDASFGKINVIQQDIGRVILNLINNAFYAVSEKKKQNIPGYEQMLDITTRKINDKIELRVRDNGNGIPARVLDKIFQPFFTTKPAGQGTGLGLSLSYDIITKGHGGELKVETKEGEGSEFIIHLPVNS